MNQLFSFNYVDAIYNSGHVFVCLCDANERKEQSKIDRMVMINWKTIIDRNIYRKYTTEPK